MFFITLRGCPERKKVLFILFIMFFYYFSFRMPRRIRYKSAANRSKSATFTTSTNEQLAASSFGTHVEDNATTGGGSQLKRAPLKRNSGPTGDDSRLSSAGNITPVKTSSTNTLALTLLSIPSEVTIPLLRQLCELYGPIKSLTPEQQHQDASPSYKATVVYQLEHSRQNAITALNGTRIGGHHHIRAIPGTTERRNTTSGTASINSNANANVNNTTTTTSSSSAAGGAAGGGHVRGSSTTNNPRGASSSQPNPAQLFKQPQTERAKSNSSRSIDQSSQTSDVNNGRPSSDVLASSSAPHQYPHQGSKMAASSVLGSSFRQRRSKRSSKSSSVARRKSRM